MNFFSSSTSLHKSALIPSLIDASDAIGLLKISRSSIKFLDSSWYMNKDRKPIEEFHQQRIVGARSFDIEEISGHSCALPHMVPSSEHFSEYMSGACYSVYTARLLQCGTMLDAAVVRK
jgi:3-mercaptopyruvate sulfurtransferase SseA